MCDQVSFLLLDKRFVPVITSLFMFMREIWDKFTEFTFEILKSRLDIFRPLSWGLESLTEVRIYFIVFNIQTCFNLLLQMKLLIILFVIKLIARIN